MARHTEPLNRGLVTIRDPALLEPGELSFIRNAVYLPGSNALQRAAGRAAAGTASAGNFDVDGLRDAKFDNGNHYMIGHVSASYVSGAVADAVTFGVLESGIGDGDQLEVVHYRNRFFLFNGTQANASGLPSNRVMYLSATAAATTPTMRQHGMLPVVAAPTVTASATAFSQTVTGYYEYWVTEVAKFNQDGVQMVLESAFSGNPSTIFVSATGMAPLVSLPGPLQNPLITTHWRIYRSPKKDKEADKKFPTGFMIAEMSTATANVLDSFVVVSASAFPASVNTGTNQFSDFASASSITADDGTYATATAAALTPRNQGAYGYNFGGFAGPVKGITVQFEAYATNGPVIVSVRIGRNRDATTGSFLPDLSGLPPQVRSIIGENTLAANTSVKSVLVTATAAPGQLVTLGSSSDRWFPPDHLGLNDADFSGNFMTVISAMRTGGALEFFCDYIKTTVHYGGTVDSVIPFPTVAYTFGDVIAQVAKNGPAPSARTGVMYEDSLVVNDESNPALIRYSYPGDPEAFPATYYIDFETPENDRVQYIGKVNGRLIVGLDSSLWRVNYLPSERDASFDRGKAIELISGNHGVVNPMCACIFSLDGGQERLAFVSHKGVMSTDGYDLVSYSDGLDWRGDRDGLGIANTSLGNYEPIALVHDDENEQLVFLFRNDAVGFGGKFFTLNFQYNDAVNGKPRVSGMVTMQNTISTKTAIPRSLWPVIRNTGVTDMYIGYGVSGSDSSAAGAGQIYRETGRTIPSSNATMRYRTRRMYLAGMANEWKLNEVYGYAGLVAFDSTGPDVTYTTDNYKTDVAGVQTKSKTFTYSSADLKLHKVIFSQMCEGVVLSASVSGECAYGQEFLILEGEDFGMEDSGA